MVSKTSTRQHVHAMTPFNFENCLGMQEEMIWSTCFQIDLWIQTDQTAPMMTEMESIIVSEHQSTCPKSQNSYTIPSELFSKKNNIDLIY